MANKYRTVFTNILICDILALTGGIFMEQIGKRLRALREGVRLTQVNMAEILGVQQSRINRYETGQSTPSPEVFIKYADYFDVSMDYL